VAANVVSEERPLDSCSSPALMCCGSGACPGYEAGGSTSTTRAAIFVRDAAGDLVVEVVDLCAPCWRRLGEPTAPLATMEETHEAMLKARAKMLARGGADRYFVRSGKAGV
jgi:hypothetical protein